MRTLAVCTVVAAVLAFTPGADAAGTFQIAGGGYGHGVGMSQYGAYGYALHGMDYRFILAHYYQGTSIGSTNPEQTVRVLVATGPASFSGASAAGTKKLTTGTTYSVRALADGSLALYTGAGKKVATFASPLDVTGPGFLDLAGHGPYRGALEFRVVGGAVQTVNAVGLDDYVMGVVAAEMPSNWPTQALEAQAVAARTYAITSNVAGDGYTLYSDTRSQAYGGVDAETPATDDAVAATSGQIVTYNGAPAETFFFSSSGGYTENVENVWLGAAPEPWLRGVPDPYDGAGGDPYHRWSDRMTMASAAAKLGSLVKGRLLGILVTKRGVSPRVIGAQVVGTRGRTNVTGPQVQGIFGLDSTYMMFTSITSMSGAPPSGGGSTTGGAAASASRPALRVFVAEVQAALAALHVPPGLHGSVFPASKGTLASVQMRTRRGWRTVRRLRLGQGGSYDLRLRAGRTYRLLWQHLAGPAVRVG